MGICGEHEQNTGQYEFFQHDLVDPGLQQMTSAAPLCEGI
jgi:hypothetical protein